MNVGVGSISNCPRVHANLTQFGAGRNPAIWEVYFYEAKNDWTVSYAVFNGQLGILLGGRQ